MFNVQGSEIIIIVLVALIVLGPEKLPDAIRRFSKFYAEIRKMSSGFQSEIRNALDEPMRELRDTADLVRKNADFREMLQDTVAPTSTTTKPAEAGPAASGPPTAPAPGLDPVNAAEQEVEARTYETAVPSEPIDAAPADEPVATEASEGDQAPEAADPDAGEANPA